MSDENTEREIATLLMCAWTEYVALYGESPHGTFTQLHSLLALQSAGRNIIALCARRAEVDATEFQRIFREERVKQSTDLLYSSGEVGSGPIRVWNLTFTDATVKKLSGSV